MFAIVTMKSTTVASSVAQNTLKKFLVRPTMILIFTLDRLLKKIVMILLIENYLMFNT
jgi:hypothetical protein